MEHSTETISHEDLKLAEALSLCQRELAQVREQQEPLWEQWHKWRVESGQAKAISEHLAIGLARHLSSAFWEEREPAAKITWSRFIASRWPWVRKLSWQHRSGSEVANVEAEHIRLIEGSPLFRPVWYLQQYADVARTCSPPAVHYLRYGADEGRDPGPTFSTRGYLDQHPELVETGINPLVHYLLSKSA